MLLRHATRPQPPSIGQGGLLTGKSQGRLPVVWLHATSKTAWATLHTIRRHGGRIEGVAVIEADVPRHWLRRNRRGLWYSVRDIPPARFRRLISFAELARSPVEEPATTGA
jgi:hypothetical protein